MRRNPSMMSPREAWGRERVVVLLRGRGGAEPMWLSESVLKLVETEASVCCPSPARKTEKKSFSPAWPPLPQCLKWKTLVKKASITLRIMMATGCSLSGRAPCPCLLSHNTPTQLNTYTLTRTWLIPMCSVALPTAVMRKGAPLHIEPIRSSPSGQVIWFLSL